MRLLNICEMPIRWTDLDAYGHLNHALFFNFITEARAKLFNELLPIKGMCHFVTAHVECSYKNPYYHPDTIILKQYCTAISNSSFNLTYEFFSEKKPNLLHALASVKMVACNPTSSRPTRLPQEVITLIAPQTDPIEK